MRKEYPLSFASFTPTPFLSTQGKSRIIRRCYVQTFILEGFYTF